MEFTLRDRRMFMVAATANLTAILALGLTACSRPLHAEDKEEGKKAGGNAEAEYARQMLVLTLPKKTDPKNCFPQRFLRVPASASRVKLEECVAQYPDRTVAMLEKRVVISLKGKYGFCDDRGVILVEPKFDSVESFTEGLSVVRTKGKYGYMGTDGQFAIKPQFDWAYSFHNGVGAVQVDRLWGLVDRHGAWIKKPSFKRIDFLKGGLYAVTTDGIEGFIDKAGNFAHGTRKEQQR